MTRLSELTALAAQEHLVVAGIAPVLPQDGVAPGYRTVALLAPDEPAFWPHFQTSPEAQDGAPNAMDRWSRRVIGRLACDAGVKATFPFAGPPYRPFIAWALRSGRCHVSPVTLLVHDSLGLFVSFRGAFLLPEIVTASPAPSPCDTCSSKPCLAACPASALTGAGYDVPACHTWLDRPEGAACLQGGCQVRHACPTGQGRRLPAQSAHHMRHFHP